MIMNKKYNQLEKDFFNIKIKTFRTDYHEPILCFHIKVLVKRNIHLLLD